MIISVGGVIENLPDELKKASLVRNKNLSNAKKAKNDEFYTQLTDIEKELSHYDPEIFRDKVIYCPTDVATTQGKILQSQFVRYFQLNASRLKFKKLIATCLIDKVDVEGNTTDTDDGFLNRYELHLRLKHGYKQCPLAYDLEKNPDYTDEQTFYSDNDEVNGTSGGKPSAWKAYEVKRQCVGDMEYSSGDFRSEECLKLLEETDIVVTNPPFSLFRDFFELMIKYEKKFLIIGNKNAITTKVVFPHIKSGKLWLGITVPQDFTVPIKEDYKSLIGLTRWFTNIGTEKRNEELYLLPKLHWQSEGVEYPKYDNYDAIEVSKVKYIPSDYDGVMGVPITFLDKYNPRQFEIIGITASWCEDEDIRKYKLSETKRHNPFIFDKENYKRLLIIKRQKSNCPYEKGDYLLFTYQDERYGGDVTRIDGSNYFVTFEKDGSKVEV